MAGPGPSSAAPRLALSASLLLAAGLARADLSGTIEPEYTHTESRSTDPAGLSSSSSQDTLVQRYRLTADRQLGAELRLSGGGTFEDTRTWSSGTLADGWNTLSRLFANVAFGNRLLGGNAAYSHSRDGRGDAATIGDSYRLTLGWHPEELPRLDLVLSRDDRHDAARARQDTTNLNAQLDAIYTPSPSLDLRYSARYANPQDHRNDTDTTVLSQSARVAYTTVLLDQRLSLATTYAVSTTETETVARRSGGSLTTQQFPTAGLAALETFPATAERIALAPAPLLVNGDTATSAGINLGFTRSLAGDTAPRDLGVQFPTRFTAVNTIYVWTDGELPLDAAATFSWAAYQSEDDLTWTPVPIVRPVARDPDFDRFVITIAETQATYLKVVTRPFPAGVTVDPRLADVLVTEVQVFLVTAVPVGTVVTSRVDGQLTAGASYRILPSFGLVYDSSLFLTHDADVLDPNYTIANGLSLARRLGRVAAVSARVDRADARLGRGHESQMGLTSMLTLDPLPTLGAAAGYSARYAESRDGTRFTNAFTALTRAELYTGIDVTASGSLSLARDEGGTRSSSVVASAGTTLAPHPRLSLNGGYSFQQTRLGGETRRAQQLTGSGAARPIGDVSVSGTVTRTLPSIGRPSTTANVAVGWSPFPGGAVQLALAYSRAIETTADSTSQFASATLRWNIRPRSALQLSYTFTDSASTVFGDAELQAFDARLTIGF